MLTVPFGSSDCQANRKPKLFFFWQSVQCPYSTDTKIILKADTVKKEKSIMSVLFLDLSAIIVPIASNIWSIKGR